jgi:hypothetical protein
MTFHWLILQCPFQSDKQLGAMLWSQLLAAKSLSLSPIAVKQHFCVLRPKGVRLPKDIPPRTEARNEKLRGCFHELKAHSCFQTEGARLFAVWRLRPGKPIV